MSGVQGYRLGELIDQRRSRNVGNSRVLRRGVVVARGALNDQIATLDPVDVAHYEVWIRRAGDGESVASAWRTLMCGGSNAHKAAGTIHDFADSGELAHSELCILPRRSGLLCIRSERDFSIFRDCADFD